MEKRPNTTRSSRAGSSSRAATRSASSAGRTAASSARGADPQPSAGRVIDARIAELGGWRRETLARMRALIRVVDPAIVEEVKWGGTPVWSRDGIVCTGESYAKVVKLTFAHGAELADPARLFNASLEGTTRRAIDLREGERLDARAFQALVKAAIARNVSTANARAATKGGSSGRKAKAANSTSNPQPANSASRPRPANSDAKAKPARSVGKAKPRSAAAKAERGRSGGAAKPVKLLSGGNPQIAKEDGDAPVEAYLAALSGWKQAVARRLDALVVRTVPGVRKAVRWNSPFYGVEGQGWFLSFHVFTKYLKVTFFRGTALHPAPAGGTAKDARWIDVHEGELDEAQLWEWIRQAAALPGWTA